MHITFTRTEAGACQASAVRDDGVAVAVIGSPGRKDVLPHDIIHYVVESELKLERGFWGCIAAGALRGVTVLSGQQKMARHHARLLIRHAKREGDEIERMVGSFGEWAFKEAGRARGGALSERESGKRLSPDEITRTIQALWNARRKWESLGPGESITVTWPAGLRARKNRPKARRLLTRR